MPVTSSGLAEVAARRGLTAPLTAHAVTDAVREALADGDVDDWEYAALTAAADASDALRVAGDRPRRFVLAVDAESVQPGEGSEVRVLSDVAWADIAAAHADTVDHAADDDELAWFARQEIPDLL